MPHLLRGEGSLIYLYAPGSLLHRSGLRTGDTIEAINGKEITDVLETISQLMALQNAASGTVRLRRGKTVRTISIKIL